MEQVRKVGREGGIGRCWFDVDILGESRAGSDQAATRGLCSLVNVGVFVSVQR